MSVALVRGIREYSAMQPFKVTWLGLATLGLTAIACKNVTAEATDGESDTSTVSDATGDGDGDAAGDGDGDTTGDGDGDTTGDGDGDTTGDGDGDTTGDGDGDTAGDGDGDTAGDGDGDTAGDGDGDTTGDGDGDTTGDGDGDATGDGDGDVGVALELIAAEITDDYDTLVLTFSDAVAPVDLVDASDFRVSYAWTYLVEYMEVYEQSYYIDPNVQLNEEPLVMTAIANGPGADQISLTLAPTLEPDACDLPANYVNGQPFNVMADAALFPHYSPGAEPVTSLGGGELAPIGGDWVLEPQDYFLLEIFHWPNLDPQIPIACP